MGSGRGKQKRLKALSSDGQAKSSLTEKEWGGKLPQKGIYLDDRHSPVEDDWQWVKTVDETIAALSENPRTEFVSLDFDLGMSDSKTGEDVIKWMVANNNWPKQLLLHTGSYTSRDIMHKQVIEHAPYTAVEETPLGPLYE